MIEEMEQIRAPVHSVWSRNIAGNVASIALHRQITDICTLSVPFTSPPG